MASKDDYFDSEGAGAGNLTAQTFEDFGAAVDAVRSGINSETGEAVVAIDLGFSNIDDAKATQLAEALTESKTVRSINLEGNEIRCDGAYALAESLLVNTVIESLDMKDNFVSDRGAGRFGTVMTENPDCSLTSLDLTYNEIKAAGAAGLAEGVKTSGSLRSLKLGGNDVGDEGTEKISHALAFSTTLTTLQLDNNNIGFDGAEAIAEALKECDTLLSLDLKDNCLKDEGASPLGEALKLNSALTSINMKNNRITDDGICVLAIGIAMNKGSLEKVDLTGNKIGERGARAIQGAKRVKKSIDLRISWEEEDNLDGNDIDGEITTSGADNGGSPWNAGTDFDSGSSVIEDSDTSLIDLQAVDDMVAANFEDEEPCTIAEKLEALNIVLLKQVENDATNVPSVDAATVVSKLMPRIDDFAAVLHIAPSFNPVVTMPLRTYDLEPRVGLVRVKMVEMFSLLFQLNQEILTQKLVESDIIATSLDFFFKYIWNNAIHHAVFAMVQCSLQYENETLRTKIFGDCKLLSRLFEAQKGSVASSTAAEGPCFTHGNLGHIIQIANMVQGHYDVLRDFITAEGEVWEAFASNDLAGYNAQEETELGGPKPSRATFDAPANAGLANLIAALTSLNITPGFGGFS